jgi:hypothetical protein
MKQRFDSFSASHMGDCTPLVDGCLLHLGAKRMEPAECGFVANQQKYQELARNAWPAQAPIGRQSGWCDRVKIVFFFHSSVRQPLYTLSLDPFGLLGGKNKVN